MGCRIAPLSKVVAKYIHGYNVFLHTFSSYTKFKVTINTLEFHSVDILINFLLSFHYSTLQALALFEQILLLYICRNRIIS